MGFGPTQGKAAQKWVADSIDAGNLYDDFKTDTLMEMQLTLFAECQLDDDTGKCKDLSEAIEALTTAVADRKNKPKTDEFDFDIALFGECVLSEDSTPSNCQK